MTVLTREVQHPCGTSFLKQEQPDLFDVTSLSDVPDHLKGIAWADLPAGYHRHIRIGTFLAWFTLDGQSLDRCPVCHEPLPSYERGGSDNESV